MVTSTEEESPSLAERLFSVIQLHGVIGDEVSEAILTATGADYHNLETWPARDITYDPYDDSFEFKKAKIGWEPTPEILKKWKEIGFLRCWICYTDGSAKYYPFEG